jgi:hypothetical protein
VTNYRFYQLSERVGLLRIRKKCFPAMFLSPEDARAIAKLKAIA